jgi:recombination protein RecT
MAKPNDPTLADTLKSKKEAAEKNIPQTTSKTPTGVPEQKNTWQSFLESHRGDIESVMPSVLRKIGGTERFVRLALTVVRRNPALLKCSPPSVLGSLMEATSLGLEPNTPLEQAHIIPFSNKHTNQLEATLIIGYRGLIDLCYNSSSIDFIRSMEVFKQDQFSYSYGSDSHLKHMPAAEGSFDDADITHFYAECRLKTGSYIFLVWSRQRVEKHRDRFAKSWDPRNPSASPWGTDFPAMGKKTMIRQLVNFLPRSAENRMLYRAIQSDEDRFEDPFSRNFDSGQIITPNNEV